MPNFREAKINRTLPVKMAPVLVALNTAERIYQIIIQGISVQGISVEKQKFLAIKYGTTGSFM